MKKRVVVTGLGAITPLGIGVEKTWQALLEGKSGIDKISRFKLNGFQTQIAGEVKDFRPEDFLTKKQIRRMDLFIQYGVAASVMAREDAGIKIDSENGEKIGVVVGTGFGGLLTLEKNHSSFLEGGVQKVSPLFIPMMIANMASGQIAMHLGAKGPNSCVVTACAAGSHSIGEAFKIIQRGDAEVMITGGAEATITPLMIAGFGAMKATSTRNDQPQKASRPFERDRDGFVPAEGSGIIILEELEAALRRGAKIYAEMVGYGLSGDAYHITAPPPDGEGAAQCMQMALSDAGISCSQVDYINAHGTSTPLNDLCETLAIKRVFKEHSFKLAVSSTKSMTGHLLGAAGGIEAIFTVLALKEGIIPPTINYENPDPQCDLDYVPARPRQASLNFAISNSFGFGGANASLVFKKFP